MSRPTSLAYKDSIADSILAIIGSEAKPCRAISVALGLHYKTTYGHLRYMAETLGIVCREKRPAANGGESKVTLWKRGEHDDEPEAKSDIKRVIWADWPRGEHGRDSLVAAFFGSTGDDAQA